MFVSCAQQDNLSVAVEMMKNKQYDNAIEMFNKIASQTNDKDIKSNALLFLSSSFLESFLTKKSLNDL